MSLELIGLPAAVSLTFIATIGYVLCRRTIPVGAAENAARQEMKRAKTVLTQLAAISQQVRKSLAQHHTTVMEFKSRLDVLKAQGESVSLQDLSQEAQRMLMPTELMAASIADAYEGIRQQTQQLANKKRRVDVLTGVGDKSSLMENIDVMLGLRKKCDVTFSVAMFDIDCFGPFNARNGRATGDEVLCSLATILDSKSRDCDQVGRLENDRFLVILPGTAESGAQAFARRMQPYIDAGMQTACSVGIAEATNEDTFVSLVNRCRQMMLQTRVSRKGNFRVHGEQSISPAKSMRGAEISEKVK